LDEKEPREGLPGKADLRFYFEYDFMPAVVMPRFMVKSCADLDEELCWRSGAVLKDKEYGTLAVVREDEHEERIYIEVSGRQARDSFATIRKRIVEINKSFEKLPFTEWVPLPDAEGHAVKYLDLIGHAIAGRKEKFVGELGKGYSVAKLLGGVEEAVEHLNELEKIVEKKATSTAVKRKGLEIIHDALKDVAKRQLTEAAKKIWELGKEVGPAIIKTSAYSFFKNMLGI